jgi:hypothetical protein
MAEPNTPPAGGTTTPPADNTQAAPPPSPAPGGTSAGGTPPPETKPALTDVPPAAPEFKLESLKMPEGLKLEGDTRGAFEKAIQEGDPNKRAQALLDLYAGEAKKAQSGLYDTFNKMNKDWVDAVKADPEIGGDNWANTQRTIAKALDTFGTPGVRQALNLTGAGNNPDVIKTFYKMAAALAEGGHASGSPPAQGGEKGLAELMYPTMKGSA